MKAVKFCIFILIGVLLLSCVTAIPVEEYNLARAAVEAARESEALTYAPGLWYKAEEAYKQGQKQYDDRRFAEAQESFVQAKVFAEKAETAARITKAQGGVPQ